MKLLRDRIFNDSDSFVTRETICTWIDKIGFEEEKKQIIDAGNTCFNDGFEFVDGEKTVGENYFDKTFNQ